MVQFEISGSNAIDVNSVVVITETTFVKMKEKKKKNERNEKRISAWVYFDALHSVPIYRFSRIAPEYFVYKLLFMAQSNK